MNGDYLKILFSMPLPLAARVSITSLFPTDFQLVVRALDFDWNPERITLTPRLCLRFIENLNRLLKDYPRFSLSIVNHLRVRSLDVV
jgi:hypothetical protein